MSSRTAAWLAWSLCALSLALTALALLLLALNLSHPNTHIFDWWFGNTLVVIDVTVAAIVASHRPENPVGWLLLLSSLAIIIGHFSARSSLSLYRNGGSSGTHLTVQRRVPKSTVYMVVPV